MNNGKYVVYFNQWFSSITDVIVDVKKEFWGKITIIASSKNKNHSYKNVVDKFLHEQWKEGKTSEETEQNYLKYVLGVCRDEHVDLFMAKKHMETISNNIHLFDAIGVKVVCQRDNLEVISDKLRMYRHILEIEPSLSWIIPDVMNIYDEASREKVLGLLESKDATKWCLKLSKDEGGTSFRKIVDSFSLRELENYGNSRVSREELKRAISESSIEELEAIMFMKLLSGKEISVDCYRTGSDFIAIARMKLEGRVEKVFYDVKLADICRRLGDALKLNCAYNVQFRFDSKYDIRDLDDNAFDKLRLLDINPRLSGGLYLETKLGLNICGVVIANELGLCTDKYSGYKKFIEFSPSFVTHVERAEIL